MRYGSGKYGQRGFTLIEMSIVLIIIGILAVMSYKGYGLYSQARDEDVAQTINRVAAALQTKLRNDSDTSTVSVASVINSGILNRSGWVVSGTTSVTNGFGSAVTFAPANLSTGGTNDAFLITFPLPGSSCGNVGRTVSKNVDQMIIGSSTVAKNATGTGYNGSAIDTACGTNANATVTMQFTFAKDPA